MLVSAVFAFGVISISGLAIENQTQTCTDSDGNLSATEAIYVKSTASNGTTSITDTCLDSWTVQEAQCVDYGVFVGNVECSAPFNIGCIDGVCVRNHSYNATNQTNQTQNCTDSDGGGEYYAKGEVSGICKDCNPPVYGVGTDQCTDAYGLKEFYCMNSTHWIWEYASCTYGCSDGACKNQTACVAEGGTIPVIQNPPPCCSGLSLIKPKENVLGISGICTAKCGNGACDSVTESNQNCPADCPANASCTDSDGGRNYYVSGAAEKGGSVSYDYCTSPAMLMEHYCWGNNIIVSSTRCPSGCENADRGESLHGACIKGKEPYCGAIGTLNQGWYKENYTSPNLPSGLVRWEKCEGCIADCRYPGTRSEGWYNSCDSSLLVYDNCSGVAPPCPAGISIKSDKEKYAIGDTIFIRIKIYDSNGKGVGGAPFYVQGWRNGESTGLSKNTVDSDGNYEIKGGVAESQLGSWTFDARYNESGCPRISSNVYITITTASRCIDSDGGLDYYEKGKVESCPGSATSAALASSACTVFEDHCTKPGVLKEGFCKDDKIVDVEYQCPAGCMDGVCISAKPTETMGFRNAYWRCQDGMEANEGGHTSCKPSEVWRKYSEDFCKGRCSAAVEKCEETGKCAGSGAGKCGVEKFAVSNECGAEPAKVCTDADGGRDAYKAGKTALGTAAGEDYCYNDGKDVVEYYCSFDGENKTETVAKEEIPCPNGCRDGACITGKEPKPYKEMRNNITIEKGWNLIAIPGDTGVGLGTCSDALKNQWAFFWWYPPENRFTSMREGEMFANIYWQYLRKTAFWAYSPESCELEYYPGNYYTMTSTVQQIQGGGMHNTLPQMYSGWNMVIFTQDMLGKEIDDIKGDCSVRAAYIYESNGWRNIINETIPSDESVLGHGFLLNVAGDCKLGGISVTPPTFPAGWVIAK